MHIGQSYQASITDVHDLSRVGPKWEAFDAWQKAIKEFRSLSIAQQENAARTATMDRDAARASMRLMAEAAKNVEYFTVRLSGDRREVVLWDNENPSAAYWRKTAATLTSSDKSGNSLSSKIAKRLAGNGAELSVAYSESEFSTADPINVAAALFKYAAHKPNDGTRVYPNPTHASCGLAAVSFKPWYVPICEGEGSECLRDRISAALALHTRDMRAIEVNAITYDRVDDLEGEIAILASNPPLFLFDPGMLDAEPHSATVGMIEVAVKPHTHPASDLRATIEVLRARSGHWLISVLEECLRLECAGFYGRQKGFVDAGIEQNSAREELRRIFTTVIGSTWAASDEGLALSEACLPLIGALRGAGLKPSDLVRPLGEISAAYHAARTGRDPESSPPVAPPDLARFGLDDTSIQELIAKDDHAGVLSRFSKARDELELVDIHSAFAAYQQAIGAVGERVPSPEVLSRAQVGRYPDSGDLSPATAPRPTREDVLSLERDLRLEVARRLNAVAGALGAVFRVGPSQGRLLVTGGGAGTFRLRSRVGGHERNYLLGQGLPQLKLSAGTVPRSRA